MTDVRRMQPMPVGYVEPPLNLDYSLLPIGLKARSKAKKFQPTNGTLWDAGSGAVDGTNRVCRIPLNCTGFFDGQHSYLSFQVTYRSASTAGGGVAGKDVGPDGDAQAFIETLRILGPDGAELERISDYNVLAAAMSDLSIGDDHALSLGAACGGNVTNDTLFGQNRTIALRAPTVGTIPGTWGSSAEERNRKMRHRIGFGYNAVAGNGESMTYNIKLMSNFLDNEKYMPLNFVSGGGVVLELTFATANAALCTLPWDGWATPTDFSEANYGYSIDQVNYVAQIVEFEEDYNRYFRDVLNSEGGIDIQGYTYHNHRFQYTQARNVTFSIPIPERSKSIKSMFLIQRSNSQFIRLVSPSVYPPLTQSQISQRTLYGIKSFQLKVAGDMYPVNPVIRDWNNIWDTDAIDGTSIYSELAKSISGLGNIQLGSVLNIHTMNAEYLDQRAPGPVFANDISVSCGFIGLDLESYAQAPGLVEQGLDTQSLALPLSWEITCDNHLLLDHDAEPLRPRNPYRLDTYACVDCVWNFNAQGLVTVQS